MVWSDLMVDRLVGRVKVIFDLPEWIPRHSSLGPLAYVEWFTPPRKLSGDHPLAQVNRSTANGLFRASIIPIDQIERSTHLIPVYRKKCDEGWTTERVLDLCRSFLVNSYLRYEDHRLLR
jgi:hypothetical protein